MNNNDILIARQLQIAAKGRASGAKPNGSPSALTPTVLSDTSIKLDWTIGSTNQDGCHIYSAAGSLVATVTGSTATKTLTGLSANTQYGYYVKEYKGSQESAASATVNATTWTSQYKAVYNAQTTQDADVAAIQNKLMKSILSVLDKLDILYIQDSHTNANGEALINWKNPGTYNQTMTNGSGGSVSSFAAYGGLTGNVTNKSYENTNYNPSTQGVHFTLNEASMGVYIRAINSAGTMVAMGSSLGSCYISPNYGGYLKFALNNAFINPSYTKGTTGLMSVVRINATTLRPYIKKVAQTDYTANATSIINATLKIHSSDGTNHYDDSQIAASFAGGLLDATDIGVLSDALDTYVTDMDVIKYNKATKVAIFGDSTIGTYSTYGSVADQMNKSGYEIDDKATSGDTFALATVKLNALISAGYIPDYTFIALGLNDIALGGSGLVSALQTFVTTLRNHVGATKKIIICTLTPGTRKGTAWTYYNNAIRTGGITGVDSYVDTANSALNDGSDNLVAAYDSGDGLHENTLGRGVIATLWDAKLDTYGL